MQTDQMVTDNGAAAYMAGELCRVGGLRLTHRALELCAFDPRARLADIGCGKGATVSYLRAAGFQACGLDCDATAISQAGPHCQVGNALALPYAAASLDGLLFECSLSQMTAQQQVLREVRRVLRPGSKLVISDLYTRNEVLRQGVPPSRALWLELLARVRFRCLLFEDRSEDLKALTAQLLWQYGRESLHKLYGCGYDEAALKAARCGYFLLIANKEG